MQVAVLGIPFFVLLQGNPSLTVISGKLVGADGKPMPVAHVHLTPPGPPGVITEGAVGPDGSYALATTQSGAFFLRFTGVNHASTFVPVLLSGSSTSCWVSPPRLAVSMAPAPTATSTMGAAITGPSCAC